MIPRRLGAHMHGTWAEHHDYELGMAANTWGWPQTRKHLGMAAHTLGWPLTPGDGGFTPGDGH